MEVDLLAIERGSVTAPAGCGKTQLITDALVRHVGSKPVLILTHTNAGVMALKNRLDRAEVPTAAYKLVTLDGWAMRLGRTFPERCGLDPRHPELRAAATDYPAIRRAAAIMLRDKHLDNVLAAGYGHRSHCASAQRPQAAESLSRWGDGRSAIRPPQ